MTSPGSRRRPRMVAEVRAEAARLYADHDTLARALRERDPGRRAEIDDALARQRAAFASEDHAWQALDDVRQMVGERPRDPAHAAMVAVAEDAHRAARGEAHAAGEQVDALTRTYLREIGAETEALLELGDRYRAA